MKIETNSEKLLFSTIKIEVSLPKGSGSGTGFFFAHPITHAGKETEFGCIVTNKHVIENSTGGRLVFTKKGKDGQPIIGDSFTLDIHQNAWKDMWLGHPDPSIDIAITPFGPIITHLKEQYGVEIYCSWVMPALIPTDEQLASLNVMETVVFVGYPNGLWDTKNLVPIMRKGTTATPLALDFEGEPKFLIDASVFGGSSGSPVFILDDGVFTDRNGNANFGSRIHFIGVIAAVYHKTDLNAVVPIAIPTQFQAGVEIKQMIDLGIAFKSKTVIETIQHFIKLNPPKK
ncbi:trypsin-like peptidase domain-containing protein [Pseudomonas juntendi]|uniref:trypsin-like peptidase domain-containing protein n=1 Tax=Pseudomonas juntendi TaxID=2666183 RepID=UPI0018D78564|nr:trypsin-like peptidase domain-containing protein [Pseudomonas juntendi]MBH3373126.1 trypsin-like peptidase domain-containing protein [Pseudomonas juntendi]